MSFDIISYSSIPPPPMGPAPDPPGKEDLLFQTFKRFGNWFGITY